MYLWAATVTSQFVYNNNYYTLSLVVHVVYHFVMLSSSEITALSHTNEMVHIIILTKFLEKIKQ